MWHVQKCWRGRSLRSTASPSMSRAQAALSTETGRVQRVPALNASRARADHQEGRDRTVGMGMLRGLSCAVTAYFVYTVLNLVTVAIAMDRMQEHRDALHRNVEALKEINQHLQAEFDALSTSPDLIRLYARDLGLYAPGERVIRLQGTGARSTFHEAGSVVTASKPPPAPRFPFLLAGLAVGGLLYVRLRFRERSRGDERSRGERSRGDAHAQRPCCPRVTAESCRSAAACCVAAGW